MVMNQQSSSFSWQDASASSQAFPTSNSYDPTDAGANALYTGQGYGCGYVSQSQSALYTVHSDQHSSSGLSAALGARTLTASSLQSALRPRAQQSLFLSTHSSHSPFSSLNSTSNGESTYRHSPSSDDSSSNSTSQFVYSHGYSGINAPAPSLSSSTKSQSQTDSKSPVLSWYKESTSRDHDFNVGMYRFPSPVPFEQEPESVSMHLSDASENSTAHPSPTSTVPPHTYYTPQRLPLSPTSVVRSAHSPIRSSASTRVKSEPDLDALDLEHPPGPPGSHFVMETPYPYTYTTRRRVSKASGTLSSPDSHNGPTEQGDGAQDYVSGLNKDRTDEEIRLEGGYIFPDPNAHEPHSLTAPLRAVNASVEMRACMGVFRLDPFAQLNGVTLRCGSAYTLGLGLGFVNGGGKKAKGKKGKGKRTLKRKRAGSDLAGLLEEEVDEDDEEEEDSPTWDGEQAGPLKFPPALIQFQLYFEGMMLEEPEKVNDPDSDTDDFENRHAHERGHRESVRETDPRNLRQANVAKGKQRERQIPRRAFGDAYASGLDIDTERKFDVSRHDHGRNLRLHINHGDAYSANISPNSPFSESPSHSPNTFAHMPSRTYSSRVPYLDRSGNIHNAISPAPQSSPVRIQNPALTQSQESGPALLQQLRTQAALRAVSSHTTQQNQNSSQRQQDVRPFVGPGVGAGMHVNFTPTPASVAAEMMHTDFLASSGRYYSQQQQQQPNRLRAPSVSSNQSLSGQSFPSYNSTLPMTSHMQASQNFSSSSASHTHTGYGSITQNSPSTYTSPVGAVASGSVTPAPISAHGHRYAHVHGNGEHGGTMLERRWNDTLQRVQG